MTQTLKILAARLRNFRDATHGSLSMEAVIMLPLLAWAYVGMFTYFDAFRTRNSAEKAAYVISDALTRVTEGVDETYINGVKKLFDYLTFSADDTAIRVTEVQWVLDDPEDENSPGSYQVTWSYNTGDTGKMTNALLEAKKSKIPNLVAGERLILVESTAKWHPIFNVGLTERTFDNFVPTSPRFSSQVAWEGASTFIGDTSTNGDADAGAGATDDSGTSGWMGYGGYGGYGGGTSGHTGDRGWH